MKRVVLVTAAFVAAVAVWAWSLPPRQVTLPSASPDGTVRGLLHVHSRASDGLGTVDEIAAAAKRVGLQFLILTDHGDGTRKPEPPSYRSGVLMLDAVEISTRQGHYLAIGLPQAPYALGGDAADVVEDVRRLGGIGIAAHPDSPKRELRWSEWTAPIDGLELINPDTSWRVHAFAGGTGARWRLLLALLAYPVRPAESIAHLLTGTAALRARWMTLAAERPLIVVAGADAHAKLALRNSEPGDNSSSIPIPSYDASFGSLSVHVTPDQPFGGDADADGAALVGGLREGHAYIAIDGWATPASFQFTATGQAAPAIGGDTVRPGTPLTIHVRSNAPAGFITTVWKGTQPLTERTEPEFEVPVGGEPAVYSVEIRQPNSMERPAWITSNAIYVRNPSSLPSTTVGPPVKDGRTLFDEQTTNGWSLEKDPTSLAVIDVAKLIEGPRVRLRFGLSGGSAVGQYAAAAVEAAQGVASADGVAFTVRAERPMRISVQVRAEVADAPPERWERSVFVDTAENARVVRFSDMTPVGRVHSQTVPKADVRAIMFVVDTTNTKPGASGRLWLGNPRLVSLADPQVRTVSTR